MLSVCMIGAGQIGESHLAAVAGHPATTLSAVADIVPGRAEAAAAPYGAKAYTDYKEMLDAGPPDLAIVNLPHALHEECALACAQRGVHILLEKPMSVSATSCARINQACEAAGVVLQVGHIQRYLPENRSVRQIIAEGKLGTLLLVSELRTTNYFHPGRPPWFLQKQLAGGGIWMNFGAHSLDKLCYLTGSQVARLWGSLTHCAPASDVDGSAQVLVKMENGTSASVTLCGYDAVPQYETLLYFSGGCLRLQTGSALWQGRNGRYERLPTDAWPEPFAAQWADFVKGVEAGQALHCGGRYGAEIVRLIESIQ